MSRPSVNMEYETAVRELGLPDDASVEQIQKAYKEKSGTLKGLMTNALRAAQKERSPSAASRPRTGWSNASRSPARAS